MSAWLCSAWGGREPVGPMLSLVDYNTRVVLLGTTMLGAACGLVGSFMLLRKRALLGDAVSHATLPGIALAFLVMVAAGGDGKWLPGLLLGALVTGLLGMGMVLAIRHFTRIKEDAALGIVLSAFYGAGVALLGVIQKMGRGSAAGLESFIYGKAASMLASDAMTIGVAAIAVALVCSALFKEFTLLCFDQDFAAAQGWPVGWLDAVMMGLVVAVTVIGLQAVGLILVVAMLILPPAAARFWTDDFKTMAAFAMGIGAAGGLTGTGVSALVPHLPAGATIVLVTGGWFAVSLLAGPARGLVARALEQQQLSRRVACEHLLRALYEREEQGGRGVSREELLELRSWSRSGLSRTARRAEREGLVRRTSEGDWCLTEAGRREAARVVRNHRLWELYLIAYADLSPGRVDRDADVVEHLLEPALVGRLEEQLQRPAGGPVPASPHALGGDREDSP